MSKKRKVIIAIILVFILAGISVGVYYLVKDNKRILIEEELKNIPFLGVEATVIDSMYHNLTENQLSEFGVVSLFSDSICSDNSLSKKGLKIISFSELNNIKKELLKADSNYVEHKPLLLLDLNTVFGSKISMLDLVFDWKKSLRFIDNISRQTGV